MALTGIDLSLLIIYAIICIIIGVLSARKQKPQDYLIADRKLGTFSFVGTVLGTYIGGGAIVAYSAYVYQFGISAMAVYFGAGIGLLAFTWYALRIRREGKKKNFHTLTDWFYDKFDNKTGILTTAIILLTYFGGLVVQFIAGSSILSSVSDLSYGASLLFIGAVILIYLTLGGFKSVVKTDVFQYLVLLLLIVILGIVMNSSGQIATELLDITKFGVSLSIAFIIYGVFSIIVAPDYWQKVYAAKSDRVIKDGLLISAFGIVFTGFLITLIGLAAGTNFPGINPSEAAAFGLSKLLPPGLLALGLILIFAAIMSTADTVIFVLASSISKDYFGRFIFKRFNDIQFVKLTRTFVVFFSILGIIFAYFFRDIIAVLLTFLGLALALAPALVASFHWKIKSGAAFASLLAGVIYVTFLVFAGYLIPELAIASIFVSLITLILFQIILRK